MSWTTKALLPYFEAKLTALPGMHAVQRGEPLDPPADTNAYVLVGGQQPSRKTNGGVYQRTGRFAVIFVVRVSDHESDAEDILADLVDAWEESILADLTCGGLTADLELNTAPADNPEYRRILGPEFRLYPTEVVIKQNFRIAPTPP